ncbi:MAG: copper amine oxidase N-terminal domain-containing protein [Candidatus Saccharibacteria bacterium]
MGKKLCVLLLTVIFLVSVCATGFAASPKVVVGDKTISFSVPPLVEQGRTYVQMRPIFVALGASIDWNENTRTITARKGSNRVTLTIGDPTAMMNEHVIYLDTPAKIVKGWTMVPLRFVTQALGAEVQWDGQSRIIINAEAKPEPPPAEGSGPGGLTGAKLEAYNMLSQCKYSGSCTGKWNCELKEIPYCGTVYIGMTTKTTGNKSTINTTGVPYLYGKNLINKPETIVPYKELVNADKEDIIKFLKSADNVKVSGNTITITAANPPDSLLVLLNSINSNLKWYYNKFDMTCKLTVKNNTVVSITDLTLKGKVLGQSGAWEPATVWCNLWYE